MVQQIEQCPCCGKFIEGIPAYGIKRKGARTGGKFVVKKVLIYLLAPLILTIIGPFGTVLGFILACIFGYYIDKAAENITDSVDLGMYSSIPFEFKCSHFGNFWKRTYEKGVDFTTDSVLKWQKDKLIKSLRNDADSNNIYCVLCGIVAFACASYCFTHESSSSHMEEVLFFNVQMTDYNWTWWFLCIIGLVTLYNSINCGIKSRNQKQEADNLEKMSVSSFRHSNYRAGNPFVGIDRPLDKKGGVSYEQQGRIAQRNTAPITQEPVKPQAPSVSFMSTTDKDHKRCPYCGEEILAVAKKCKHCGEWLDKEPEQQKEMTRCSVCGEIVEKGLEKCPLCNEHLHPSHIAIEEDVSTKECMFCGETILEIANKCKHCGEWQKKKKQYVPCPICGELIEEGTEICPYCKEAMIKSKPKETVPCPICGEQIEVGIDKCPYCHESQKRCPLCGETIPLNSKICPVCNSDLTEL